MDLGPNTLPCEVASVIEEVCAPCHASPPSAGAIMPLLGRHDMLAPSQLFKQRTVGEVSLERLLSASSPMPPLSEPAPSEAQRITLKTWLEQGMPPGDCAPLPAKPLASQCASGAWWTQGNAATLDMNPGLPCRDCHARLEPDRAYFFAGTVYPSYHEQDLCKSSPPTDTRVEILDESGTVRLTLVPNAVGNFQSGSAQPGVPLPYRARVIANGRVRAMNTPQTSGDCNACHTEQGAENAPGRIVYPAPPEEMTP